MDNDGDIDIVVQNNLNSNLWLYWYENLGNLNFFSHRIKDINAGGFFEVKDIDGDQMLDIIKVTNTQVIYYKNAGSGNFVENVVFQTSSYNNLTNRGLIKFGDINGDGYDDIINMGHAGGNLRNILVHEQISNHDKDTINITACDAHTYFDGTNFTSDTILYDTLTNMAGCDSIQVTVLDINYSSISNLLIDTCEQLSINGQTFTQSGNYTQIITNSAGCDSVISIDLNIFNNNIVLDTRTVCDSLAWIDGNTYYSSNNTASYNIAGIGGCDT